MYTPLQSYLCLFVPLFVPSYPFHLIAFQCIPYVTVAPCASYALYQTDTPNPLLGLLQYPVLSCPSLRCPVLQKVRSHLRGLV